MTGNDKKRRLEMEDGMLAICPIVFDSPETRTRLIEVISRGGERFREPKMPIKSITVLPGGCEVEELEDLLAEFSDELFVIH